MCELKVVLDGKTVFKDCIYMKYEDNNVVVKNISGLTVGFLNVDIIEVSIINKIITLKTK